MSPPLPPLPPNVKHLLSAYIGETRLKELPACFTYRPTATLHKTVLGNPITYKHAATDETLHVESYIWNLRADKFQSVVIASGRSLTEPVIIVPVHNRLSMLNIWRGENDEDRHMIYKVFGGNPTYTNVDVSHTEATVPASDDEELRVAAKRQKTHHKTTSPNLVPTNSVRRSVAETDTTPYVVASESSEDESSILRRLRSGYDGFAPSDAENSEDEPSILRGSRSEYDWVAPSEEVKLVSGTTGIAAVRRQTAAVSVSGSTKITPFDLRDTANDNNIRDKSEPEDGNSTANASSLLAPFSTTAVPSGSFASKLASRIHNPTTTMTPTSISSLAPTPEQLPLIRSFPSARATPGPVNDATTLIFFNDEGRELRRRTFADLGRRLNVGTLFGQAIRVGLIGKSDFDAILSVTIPELKETFAIVRDDAPDFAKLMRSIEDVGLCTVEVRLD